MKLRMILAFLLPSLEMAAAMLSEKDQNTTGADDEAAAAIRFCVERLRAYQAGS